ncbi:MAG: PilN domain-containing protein [Caldisericia bacterium]
MKRQLWGIQITETFIAAVLVERVGEGFAVARDAQAPLAKGVVDPDTGACLDAGQLAGALRTLTRTEHIRGPVSMMLPEAAYVSRLLRVPPMKPQELTKVIRNELSRYAAYRGADFLFDYTSTPVGVQLAVYTSSVKRDVLAGYRTATRRAGLSVALVGDSLQSTVQALAEFTGVDVTHRPCVAVMSRSMTRLGIAEHTIEASSSIDMGQSELASDVSVALLGSRIKSALSFFEQELSVEPGDLYICSDEQLPTEQVQGLALRINRPVHIIVSGQDGASSVAAGAAILGFSPTSAHACNNLLAHLVAQHAERSRKWVAALVLVVLANAALSLSWHSLTAGFASIQRQEAATAATLINLRQQTQELDTLQVQATDLTAQLSALANTQALTGSDFTAADFRTLANAIPQGVTITHVSITGNSLAVDGTATAYAAIGKLLRSWTSTDLVQAGTFKSAQAQEGYRFRCEFQTTKEGQS